jgi:cell wall-associated NlpC family hydrolase
VASHRHARRRPGLARATSLVAATVSAAGIVPALAHADPLGGSNGAGPYGTSGTRPSASRPNPAGSGPAGFNPAGFSPAVLNPAPGSFDAIKQQITALYQQAEASTQQYDATEERIARLQAAVASSSTRSAQLRDQLTAATGSLGRLAAEQYRDAGMSPSMALVFSAHPDSYLERAGLTDRVATVDQQRVVAVLRAQQQLGTQDHESATELADLHAAELQLAAHRADIQTRLAEARNRLDSLGAAERASVTAALAGGDNGDGLGTTMPASAPSLSSLLSAITDAATNAASAAAAATANLGADSANDSSGTDVPVPPSVSRVVKAVETAYNELGKPYVWGATGPGEFDCSGLTQHVWAAAGVQLPRTSQEQANSGQTVSVSGIRPGDLVVYFPGATHIGIYVGHGLVIHAPRPGSFVQFTPLGSMPINRVVRPVS